TEAREAQIAEMKRKMMQQQRDAEALDRAQDETMAQFEKGNYLEGSRPLAYEFAKQGNAAGAYGTIGVAAGAQVVSWAAEAKRKKEAAEREQREAERIRAEREERERRMREERERLEREAFALLIRQRHTILEA